MDSNILIFRLSILIFTKERCIPDMTNMRFCPHCRESLVQKEIDEKMRLSCSKDSCGYVFWDSPTPVIAAIVEHNGMIIFARNKEWPENMFGLISGFLEKDESTDSGILREIHEELGLDGEIVELIGLYPFSMMNQLLIVYYVSCKGDIKIGEELAEIKAVLPEEIEPWEIGTGPAVLDWMKKRGIK